MKSFRAKPVGWRYEAARHSLAAKGISSNRYEVRKYAPSHVIGRSRTGTLAGTLANIYAGKERKTFKDAQMAGSKIEARAKLQKELAYRPLNTYEEKLKEAEYARILSPAEKHRDYLLNVRTWKEVADDRGNLLKKGIEDYNLSNDREIRAELKQNIRKNWREYKGAKKNLDYFRVQGYSLDPSVEYRVKNLLKGSRRLRTGEK